MPPDFPKLSDYIGRPLLLGPMGHAQFVAQLGGQMQPLTEGMFSQVRALLSGIIPGAGAGAASARYMDDEERTGTKPGADPLWDSFADGIATIRVSGPLYDRAVVSQQKDGSLLVHREGYDRIGSAHAQAQLDPRVKGIVYQIDSPGGLVNMSFETYDYIKEMKALGGKPVRAIVTACACSAAYGLAATADHISATSTSMIGSIGTLILLSDHTGWDEKIGIKTVAVHAGAFKTDGHGFKEIDEAEQARLSEITTELQEVFTSHVAAGRGMDQAKVLEQEAGVFTGRHALTAGLVDSIATPRAARAAFITSLSGHLPDSEISGNATGSTSAKQETSMSFKSEILALLEADNSTMSIADKQVLQAAVATAEAEDEKSRAEGADGADGEMAKTMMTRRLVKRIRLRVLRLSWDMPMLIIVLIKAWRLPAI